VVYVGSEDHKLYAYAVGCNSGGGTCTPLWTATTGGMILGSPAYSNSKVYVGSMDGKLYAFDATGVTGCSGVVPNKTCLPLWTAASGSIQNSSPAVAGGVVYVGSDDFDLYAFDAAGVTGCSGVLPNKTCTPLWHGVTGSWVVSSPAVANGVVYVGSADHKLYAYAVGCNTGGGFCSPLWTATTGNEVNSSPAVANGVVYVGSEDHKLYAFAANGGTGCTGSFPLKTCPPLWTATTGGMIDSSPAVTDGLVYVGSEDYKLYAYALSAATTLVVTGIANPYVAGAAHSVTVTAKDVHGHVAGGYRGTVHFTSTDAKALLPANYTFTSGDAGIHKFSVAVTLKTAGLQAVRARDTVTSTITGLQSGIVVTPAAATTLTVSGLTSPRTHGTAGTITVTAHDAYGNVATGYLGTITFTSTDTKATLPANYTFTAANAGTHTFSVTLKTAGTQAVRARDTVTATITGLQSGIVVT
jgi:outer membrane protein assembly factor BamB